ncbi:MAG: M4 family metallopeptidase [Anaerolineaceae bacterium]|jgi:Zn-dependent metalloprotease
MCLNHSTAHHPVFCIVPPFILQSIAEHGSVKQKECAISTLRATAQFRGERRFEPLIRSLEGIQVQPGITRRVYSAQNRTTLPGVLVRSEGDPPGTDVAVNEAYDGAGNTYDLYHEVYNRDSIDNAGMDIESVVHYGTGYDNAFWNGRYMVYGDGDEDLPEAQRLFNRFTIALDVIGHELTHGVVSYTANLYYYDQSGALNESMADVFGILTKQRTLHQTAAESDWVIGSGLFTPNVQGVGIRSMSNPGTAYNDPILGRDPQPGHMDNYVNTTQDNGGVHINSGIPNRAFYVTALEIGGNAWEKAGRIWYVTLRDQLTARATFQQAADHTYSVAGSLFGSGSLEQQAVRLGWREVGIHTGSEPPPTPPGDNKGCLPTVASLLRSRQS